LKFVIESEAKEIESDRRTAIRITSRANRNKNLDYARPEQEFAIKSSIKFTRKTRKKD
jgi:hypothetical protein